MSVLQSRCTVGNVRSPTLLTGAGLAAAGALLLSACEADWGSEPLTEDQIRSVLLTEDELPGTVVYAGELFGLERFDGESEDAQSGVIEKFGRDECTEAIANVHGTGSAETVLAYGQLTAFVELDDTEPEDYPEIIAISITSYEDEVSMEEKWDETQTACHGEHYRDASTEDEVSFESAEIGEFRGLAEHWKYGEGEGVGDSAPHFTLSYAHGHQVVRINGTVDETTVQQLITQQLDALEEGFEAVDDDAESTVTVPDLPEEQLTSAELAELLVQDQEFPFAVEYAEVLEGEELDDELVDPWGSVAGWVLPGVLHHDEGVMGEEFTTFFAHHESGHNALRIAGVSIAESEMYELLEIQLDKLSTDQ